MSRKISYSAAEISFLRRHKSMKRRELHPLFVETFGRSDVTYYNIRSVCKKHGLTPKGPYRANYTRSELAFVRRHRRLTSKELHAKFLERFDRPGLKPGSLAALRSAHGWTTGRASGEKPAGTERINGEGYVTISLGYSQWSASQKRGRGFVLKHRWLWEERHGAIPNGFKLKCLDGNKLNTDPSNWECVPGGVVCRLNRRGFETAPAALKPTIMAVVKLRHALNAGERR